MTKEEVKKEVKKYTVKPPKDLRSKFEAKVEAKKKGEEEEKERKRREDENARIAVSCTLFVFTYDSVCSFQLKKPVYSKWYLKG